MYIFISNGFSCLSDYLKSDVAHCLPLRYCSKCIAMISVINTSMVSANSVADGDSYCNAVRIQNSNSLFNKLKTDKSDFSFHGCGPIIAYNRFMI